MTQFIDLGFAEPILRALREEGYTQPTPIQAQAIPPLLQNKDLLGIAQTGTGKTAAFAIPILNRLILDKKRAGPKKVRALVLAPTRELAVQIAASFRTYGRFAGIRVGMVIGGVSPGPQLQQLAGGLDVLVATPGRLLDHMSSGGVQLNETEVVVLDEADHMLDLGFVVPIRKILAKTPKSRQSLFFSATMPKEIAVLAGEMLTNPVEIRVTPQVATADRVTQEAFLIEHPGKPALLTELLKRPGFTRSIVFTRTKRGADKVARHLETSGISAAAIHGNKSQSQRQRTLDDFKKGKTKVLVATDIAARGIDIDAVSHVVNFDLPDVPEAYVHRIGRTARAGAEGIAISLCAPDERGLLRDIERLTRQSLPLVDRRSAKTAVTAADEERRPVRAQNQRPQQRPEKRAGDREGQRQRQGQRPPQHEGQRPAQHNNGHHRSGEAPRNGAPQRKTTRRPFPQGQTARA